MHVLLLYLSVHLGMYGRTSILMSLYFFVFINTQADKVQNIISKGLPPVSKTKQTGTVKNKKQQGAVGKNIVPRPDREDELIAQPESKVLYSYLCISLCNHVTLVITMLILT